MAHLILAYAIEAVIANLFFSEWGNRINIPAIFLLYGKLERKPDMRMVESNVHIDI